MAPPLSVAGCLKLPPAPVATEGPIHSDDDTGWHALAVASAANRSAFVAMTNGDSGAQALGTVLMSEAMQRFLKTKASIA